MAIRPADIKNLREVVPEVEEVASQLTTDQVQAIYFDAFLGKLEELYAKFDQMDKRLAEMTAEGYLEAPTLYVTDKSQRFDTPVCRYICVKNTGNYKVYVMQHPGGPTDADADLRVNGELPLNFGTARKRTFWVVCDEGETATIKIFTW